MQHADRSHTVALWFLLITATSLLAAPLGVSAAADPAPSAARTSFDSRAPSQGVVAADAGQYPAPNVDASLPPEDQPPTF